MPKEAQAPQYAARFRRIKIQRQRLARVAECAPRTGPYRRKPQQKTVTLLRLLKSASAMSCTGRLGTGVKGILVLPLGQARIADSGSSSASSRLGASRPRDCQKPEPGALVTRLILALL